MIPLSPQQLEALRMLRAAYPDARIALIGAAALAFHTQTQWRKTADLDLRKRNTEWVWAAWD